MVKVKSAIRTARRNKDITQQELANEFNITRVTVSNWERGATTPTVHELVKLSVYLDVTLEELMSVYNNKGVE
jgi:transcriptional regulator with XRE-family HTH domain